MEVNSTMDKYVYIVSIQGEIYHFLNPDAVLDCIEAEPKAEYLGKKECLTVWRY